MFQQGTSLTKCLAAYVALIWPLSSVCPLMYHQGVRSTECLATHAALIWLFSIVYLHQITCLIISLVVWFERTTRRTIILEPIFTVFTPDKLTVIGQLFLVVWGCGHSAASGHTRVSWLGIATDRTWSCVWVWRHTGCEHSVWLFLSSALALFIRIFRCSALLVRSSLHFWPESHFSSDSPNSTASSASTAVSFVWIFLEFGFPAKLSSLSRNRPNEVWLPLAGFSSFESGVDLPSRADEHALCFVKRFPHYMYDTVLKCRVLARRDFRGAFDLFPKTELGQMERPLWAFDFAILPVQSDPEPLEQRSNGSTPWAEPSELTESQTIWAAIKL